MQSTLPASGNPEVVARGSCQPRWCPGRMAGRWRRRPRAPATGRSARRTRAPPAPRPPRRSRSRMARVGSEGWVSSCGLTQVARTALHGFDLPTSVNVPCQQQPDRPGAVWLWATAGISANDPRRQSQFLPRRGGLPFSGKPLAQPQGHADFG